MFEREMRVTEGGRWLERLNDRSQALLPYWLWIISRKEFASTEDPLNEIPFSDFEWAQKFCCHLIAWDSELVKILRNVNFISKWKRFGCDVRTIKKIDTLLMHASIIYCYLMCFLRVELLNAGIIESKTPAITGRIYSTDSFAAAATVRRLFHIGRWLLFVQFLRLNNKSSYKVEWLFHTLHLQRHLWINKNHNNIIFVKHCRAQICCRSEKARNSSMRLYEVDARIESC